MYTTGFNSQKLCTFHIDYTYLNETDGACNTCVERRVVYRVLLGKPERNRTLGGPRRKWEDNIKMDLQEVDYSGMDCIDVA